MENKISYFNLPILWRKTFLLILVLRMYVHYIRTTSHAVCNRLFFFFWKVAQKEEKSALNGLTNGNCRFFVDDNPSALCFLHILCKSKFFFFNNLSQQCTNLHSSPKNLQCKQTVSIYLLSGCNIYWYFHSTKLTFYTCNTYKFTKSFSTYSKSSKPFCKALFIRISPIWQLCTRWSLSLIRTMINFSFFYIYDLMAKNLVCYLQVFKEALTRSYSM